MTTGFSLERYGIDVPDVVRNGSPAVLYEAALREDVGSAIASSGALIAYSGEKTGRSPGDKRLVEEADSSANVWWGDVNVRLDEDTFQINRQRAIDYLNTRDHVYCVDGFVSWHPEYRRPVRVICARAYHALFMHNMLIRPTREELDKIEEPAGVIFNAGGFPANRYTKGVTSTTSLQFSIRHREFVILGTEYAGEMKKGIFTVANYIGPEMGHLTMHCSATEGTDGSTSILFGLSGTGKTTLSADPNRRLIGDDEHSWSDEGIFNVEGGCYAKVIDLSEEDEPEIWRAIRFGTVLENVVYDPDTHEVDYANSSITENTRACYPIEHIDGAKIPSTGDHPRDVVFLTCDAFGVLPPVSRLTLPQAMYQFISGYTAKVAGTEMGITEPRATFSPCFGGPFLVWHPIKYAELLAERVRANGANVWLVNTGWTGGGYGVGSRIKIAHSRAIIDAIHSGALQEVETAQDAVFGLSMPTRCPNVPAEMLRPKNTWKDGAAYEAAARELGQLFRKNFEEYEQIASAEICKAGPRI